MTQRCISSNQERWLKLYAALLERSGFTSLAAIGLILSLFQIMWTFFEASGAVGSVLLVALILFISLVPAFFLVSVRHIRWAVIDSAIGASLKTIRRHHDPAVVIGVGRGGAHIAAMLCHKLAGETGVEPFFVSIDRVYFAEERVVAARVSDLTVLRYNKIRDKGNVLLVTAEVHSGDTLRAASERLQKNCVEHETFTFTKGLNSQFKVSFYVVETDLRNFLPWPFSPVRREMLTKSETDVDIG